MDAVFTFQVTVGEIAFQLQRNRLDSGFIAFLNVTDRQFVVIGFCPAHIHSHQHGSPVLTFCSTGTGIDFKDAAHLIGFTP